MTKHTICHTGEQVQPYPDDYGLGQKRVARIRRDIALAEIAKAAPDAFSIGYVNPDWRAMKRRIVAENQADLDRANAILGGAL